METSLQLRAMTKDDLAGAHALSREQKWPHRLEDWDFLLQAGEGVVADQDGEIVGSAMSWPYDDRSATLGMVIVSTVHQGRGVGRKLMNALIEQLGDRTVLLNATEEGLPLYRSLGFEAVGGVVQHHGAAFSVPIAELQPDERVRPMGASDIAVAQELDRQATGMDRAALIAALCENSQGVMLTRAHEPVGFALFRRFGRGYVIGPAIAPDAGGAKALISHWLGSNAGMFCRLDVFDDSGLSDWLEDLGLPAVGRVTRMIRGEAPPCEGPAQTFSLINQALR